ncbi:hypothetical protein DLAC_11450 [Tieghemostelium lacteum]|uniref:Uncharacterized protein n=1 Tax=Tieghemostelium lacteum TaxID=361077 RepID=A0A152A7B7_TIELA|nr:hypothetical protein DLAC_11450 [Tieghemostelium lacteum]|eukprot:KYR02011.1 hypothetical protein DLAC_11450 [Tieghemostelium lacteum]
MLLNNFKTIIGKSIGNRTLQYVNSSTKTNNFFPILSIQIDKRYYTIKKDNVEKKQRDFDPRPIDPRDVNPQPPKDPIPPFPDEIPGNDPSMPRDLDPPKTPQKPKTREQPRTDELYPQPI